MQIRSSFNTVDKSHKSDIFVLDGQYDSTNLWFSSSKCRSSHQRCSVKKGVLKNFEKFTEKHLCQSLFLIQLHRCFPVNYAKFIRTPFLQTTSKLLLLEMCKVFLYDVYELRADSKENIKDSTRYNPVNQINHVSNQLLIKCSDKNILTINHRQNIKCFIDVANIGNQI